MNEREYFTSELGVSTWNKKYRYNNESLEEWFARVSGGNKEIEKLIRDKKFIFGGRILANRGTFSKYHKITYSNCYVLDPPQDTLESIFDTAKNLARTFSYGGGCGIDISKLRPLGSKVRNSAETTTGATSFMDLYSQVTDLIGQKGRRGALMISMSVTHPDIIDFINIKTDLDKVTKANISVRVTDNFMEKAIANENYLCSFDVLDNDGEVLESVYKELNARKILMLIAENNWKMGEPGLLFWDRIESQNFLSEHEDFKYAGTNPCVVGDTLVQTVGGNIPIKDLVGKTPYVYCMDEEGKLSIKQATKVWMTRKNAKLIKITHLRGELICTPDHKVYTTNRGWVEAKDVKPKDKLNGLNRRMKDETHCAVKLSTQSNFTSEHRFILGNFEDITNKDVHHIDGNPINNVLSNLESLNHGEHSTISNLGHEDWCERDIEGKFVSNKSNRTSYVESKQVNKKHKGLNFIVQTVEKLDYTEDVYDMIVKDYHNFVANDIIIHNCGELPLPANGSCNLGSINLSSYVLKPFTEHSYFDWDSFREDVKTCVIGLNQVLLEGAEFHPLKDQIQAIYDYRQIGLGVIGLADMLIKLGYTYGEGDSVILCRDIWNTMLETALIQSASASCGLNSFKGYSFEKFENSNMGYLVSGDTRGYIHRNGLFNSQLLTIPPGGSISLLFNCSSGIEPNFQWNYKRKIESMYDEPKIVDVEAGVVAEYHKVYPGKELPSYFVNAHEVNFEEKVILQSAIQEFIDGSISSTVNLPEEATVQDVADLYMLAYKLGCKGITVYRNNCQRQGVLTTNEPKKETLIEKHELARGEKKPVAEDTVYYKKEIKIGCGELNLFIGYSHKENALQDFWVKRKGKGGCECNIEGQVISMSMLQRVGASFELLKTSFNGISTCNSFTRERAKGKELSKGSNCSQAIFNTLEEFVNSFDKEPVVPSVIEKEVEKVVDNLLRCPECNTVLEREGGCYSCSECGYSRCE